MKRQRGGSFLETEARPVSIFTPEQFTEEHRMIAKMVDEFVAGEIEAEISDIEQKKEGLLLKLLQKAGELGLLSMEIPEEYDGMGMDKISAAIVTERISRGENSFAITLGVHTGIGSLPIVLYGSNEQKKRYLPAIAAGKLITAYCLTETSAGSDAMAIKTTARLSEDGDNYILNGSKQFITNASIAHLFIIYAKIDGTEYTAFIVEKDTAGLSIGPEEEKLGIRGSSTGSIFLDDVKVPAANILGTIGRGHHIAFNILNIGRFKLAAGCLGAAKRAMEEALKYAQEREQFGRSILDFGMIKEKIADMVMGIYTAESMFYRTAGLIQEALDDIEEDDFIVSESIKEYAMETSINKVYISEVLHHIVDDTLQIFGGYGYTSEYPAERMYRDARINRIYEGTNEINRIIITNMLLKNRGQDLVKQSCSLLDRQETRIINGEEIGTQSFFSGLLSEAKKICTVVAGRAWHTYGQNIMEEGEIIAAMADIVIKIFAMDSVLRRWSENDAGDIGGLQELLVKVFFDQEILQLNILAQSTLASILSGEELQHALEIFEGISRYCPVNRVQLKREIFQAAARNMRYPL